jgi:hypothetical protein
LSLQSCNSQCNRGGVAFAGTVQSGKTGVTRTSDGFTATNPSAGITSISVAWGQDTTQMRLQDAGNSTYNATIPFSFDVEVNTPINQGQSITFPFGVDMILQNSKGTQIPNAFKTGVMQLERTNYTSVDGKFRYSYNAAKQEMTITSLVGSSNSFNGMTFTNFVGMPIEELLFGNSVADNVMNKDSQIITTINVGNQTTSETLTQLDTVTIDDTQYPNRYINMADRTQPDLANITLPVDSQGGIPNVVGANNAVDANKFLDGGMTHVVYSLGKNLDFATDPEQVILNAFDYHIPLGTLQDGSTLQAIYFRTGSYTLTKHVLKNFVIDRTNGTVSFDISRNRQDWQDWATDVLANGSPYKAAIPFLQKVQAGNAVPVVTFFLTRVVGGANSIINPNNPYEFSLEFYNNNDTTLKTGRYYTINPVKYGVGDTTVVGVKQQFVDLTGKAIGAGITSSTYHYGDSFDFTPPAISGYQFIGQNTPEMVNELSLTDLVGKNSLTSANDYTGQINNDLMLGKTYNLVDVYAQNAKVDVIYRDVDANALTPNQELAKQTLNGAISLSYDNQQAYNAKLAQLQAQGYELVQADPQSGTYDAPSKTLYVDLKHKVKTVDNAETKDITQTIHFIDKDKNQMFADNVQVLHFSKSEMIDQVTNQVLQENWSDNQSTDVVNQNNPKGYFIQTVENEISGTNKTDTNVTIPKKEYSSADANFESTVVYNKDAQKVNVEVVDVFGLTPTEYDSKGKVLSDYTQVINGNTNEDYTNAKFDATLDDLAKANYLFVQNDVGAKSGTFDDDKTKDQTYRIYVDHKTQVNNEAETKDVTQTIRVVDEKNNNLLPEKKQSFHFAKSETVDLVTNSPIVSSWDNSQSSAVYQAKAPIGYSYKEIQNEIEGSKADNVAIDVPSATYSYNSEDFVSTIVYTKDEQKVLIEVYDVTGLDEADYANKGVLQDKFTQTLIGKSFDKYDNTEAFGKTENALKQAGFKVVKAEDGVKTGTFDSNAKADQVYKVFVANDVPDVVTPLTPTVPPVKQSETPGKEAPKTDSPKQESHQKLLPMLGGGEGSVLLSVAGGVISISMVVAYFLSKQKFRK